MAYKINGTTVVDNSRNVCACCVTSCCITASSRMDAPSGNTASRPGSPATGSIYFDTDLGSLISYDGSAWSAVGGSGALEVDDITTSDTEAWIAMSMTTIDGFTCRCFRCCNHGGPPTSLSCIMPGTNCFAAECYAPDINTRCRYDGCTIPAYVEGDQQYCTVSDPGTMCFLSNYRAPSVRFRGSFTCTFACAGLCFPITQITSGYDGVTAQMYHSLCNFGPFGFFPNCTDQRHYEQFFINRKGGVTSSHGQDPKVRACCCCASLRHPYKTFSHYRYQGFTKYGAIPGIRAPIACFPRASSNLKCGMTFIVTSDTYGTGAEEICCWGWEHHSSGSKFYNWYRVGNSNQILDLCMNICPCQTFYNNGCMFCCLCHSLASVWCCCCKFFCVCTHGIFEFFNKKTDVYGGSNVTDRQAFSKTICTHSDGLTCKAPDLGCNQFAITATRGFEQCCVCFAAPHDLYAGTNNCRLWFLSRDGCYIHFVKLENLSNNGTAACCCKIDNQNTSSPTCWSCFKRPYYARINRVTACYDCFYGACCLCFPTVMCCMGCVKGSSCFPQNQTVVADPSFVNIGFNAPRPPEDTMGNVWCNNAYSFYNCGPSNQTFEDFSWNAWSHVCTRKAIFHNFCANNLKFTIFDCCKELIERSTNLFKLTMGCDWRKFALLYGAGPCYICQCGASIPEYCFLMGKCDSTRNHCCLACCVCAITGCIFQSLSVHCLGHVLMKGSQVHGCFGFLPPGNGTENHTYINKANDHIVMIRGFSHDTAPGCNCGSGFYWVGAICYDIHNDCISKVNTFFPAPICEMERLNCNYPVVRNNNCCDTPLEQRCTRYNFWKACKPYSTVCNSNSFDGGNFISAVPYGTYQYWIESGCTDLGGVNLTMSNFGGELVCAQCNQSETTFYWSCTGQACNLEFMCCTYMCIQPGFLRIARVPYSTPLECIGWRNDTYLACWMNQWFFPEKGGVPTFAVATAGDACHKCMICCAFGNRHFMHPCVKISPTNNCFVCHVYGTCDCNRGNKEFKIWHDCCCVYFCCCIATGHTANAWCAVKFCCLFKRTVNFGGTGQGPYCLCQSIIDNIKPCHLDSNETSKRYVSRFIQDRSPVVSRPYHVDGSGEPFFYKWVKANAGEDANSRFSRLWNEDVIQCC